MMIGDDDDMMIEPLPTEPQYINYFLTHTLFYPF